MEVKTSNETTSAELMADFWISPATTIHSLRGIFGFHLTVRILRFWRFWYFHAWSRNARLMAVATFTAVSTVLQKMILMIFRDPAGIIHEEAHKDCPCRGFIKRFHALIFKQLVHLFLDDLQHWYHAVHIRSNLKVCSTIDPGCLRLVHWNSAKMQPQPAWKTAFRTCFTVLKIDFWVPHSSWSNINVCRFQLSLPRSLNFWL